MKHQQVGRILAVCMLFGAILTPTTTVLGAPPRGMGPTPILQTPDESGVPAENFPFLDTAQTSRQKPRVIGETDPGGTDRARYIVLLDAEPLALYRGGVEGMAATNPAAAGEGRLRLESARAQAYLGYLGVQQTAAFDAISAVIGRAPVKAFEYRITLNGFTLEMTPTEAAQVVAMGGVKSVQRDALRELLTDAGPAWIGAPGVWDGSAVAGGVGTMGEGMVVGILDTGINMDHPSFAATGGDGYTHVNPRDKYYGVCDAEDEAYDADFTCNEKLIGAWDFVDGHGFFGGERDGPEDNDGHGSHTASTVAGNKLPDTVLESPTARYEAPISGVAPHANIIAYDVCAPEGCPLSSIEAGIEQAAADQVDVINFSIGGGPESPWQDSIAMAFLAASEAGVTVAAAAGNEGPDAGTVGSPANAPWLISVGASSHNRKISNSVIDMTGGNTPPPDDIEGKGLTGGYGPAPIVYAGDYSYNANCEYFEPGTFHGEIVLCDRGFIGRGTVSNNIRWGGAGGLILANSFEDGGTLLTYPHALPTVQVSYADGLWLKWWLAAGTNQVGSIAGAVVDRSAVNGDVMAEFSSRGPNKPLPDVLKPDITAPGVDIFAAYKDPEQFQMASGTSMSSPYVAGAVALIKAAHSDWTPAEIKSALMLTAQVDGMHEKNETRPADPFARGAGRVDVSAAVKAGFLLAASGDAFQNANPLTGGEPTTLNLASLSEDLCIGSCSWTRTLTGTSNHAVAWTVDVQGESGLSLTVDPPNFTLTPGSVQTITINAVVNVETLGHWTFGQVSFTPDSDAVATAHFPVTIFSSAGELADVVIHTRRDQGVYTIPDLTTLELNDLVATVYAAEEERLRTPIGYDPTTNPYDLDSPGVFWTMRTITDTTKLFTVKTSESTAFDIDLFVGLDSNGNGRPDPVEELCAPSTYSNREECRFTGPMEAGDYWILVYNYGGVPYTGVADFLLTIAIVTESDVGEFSATGPTHVEAGAPFDLDIGWDIPGGEAGDNRIGVLEVSDSASGVVLLSSNLSFIRMEDDVSFTSTTQTVWPGRTVTYAIGAKPEPINENDTIGYTFVATLPPGMTYLSGSASVKPTSVDGNVITWGNAPITRVAYVMSDNDHNQLCNTSDGGYIDLASRHIAPRPELVGDNFVVNADNFYYDPDPYSFYGAEFPSFYVTANGFGTFDPDVGEQPGVNSDLPDPTRPNSLIAPFWRDLEVVYESVFDYITFEPIAVRGVSIGHAEKGGEMVIEYDDVEPAPAGSTQDRYDFEIVLRRQVDDTPGAYEIVLAYDNIHGASTPATVGIENNDGTEALKYAYNDAQIHDGLMICYDWTAPVTTITFQAMVADTAAAPSLVTTLEHRPNAPGYRLLTENLEFVSTGEEMERLFLPTVTR